MTQPHDTQHTNEHEPQHPLAILGLRYRKLKSGPALVIESGCGLLAFHVPEEIAAKMIETLQRGPQ